jgi:O-succinylbenzoic acid--CoA ligase
MMMRCPLAANAQAAPHYPALIGPRKTWTYLQTHQAVEGMRVYLRTTCPLQAGQRCAVIAGNSTAYIITLLALWRENIIPCLLNTRFPYRQLEEWAQTLSCRFVFHDFERDNPCSFTMPGRNLGDIDWNPAALLSAGGGCFISSEQEAAIILTSGSGGIPKAAVLTYGNHYFNALGSRETLPFGCDDRWLLSLPLYHVSGLSLIFRVFLGGGSLVVPGTPFDLANALRQCPMTHISLVPAQLIRLLEDPESLEILKRCKAILLGGSAISGQLLRRAKQQRLAVYLTYGLTEMASQVATASAGSVDRKAGGGILPYREVRISSEGEILVRGKTRFKGYWAEGRLIEPFDTNGWFATGDMGGLDAKGRLFVTGRKDNMFVSGGENIHPETIERQLAAIVGIEQAIVVALAHPEYGQRPVGFIRFLPSAVLTVQDIKNKLAGDLPRFMIPDRFYAWPEHVLSSGMKIPRKELIRLAESQEKNLIPLK